MLVVESPIIRLVDHFELSVRKHVKQCLRVARLHVVYGMLEHLHLVLPKIYAIPKKMTKSNLMNMGI